MLAERSFAGAAKVFEKEYETITGGDRSPTGRGGGKRIPQARAGGIPVTWTPETRLRS